MCLDFVSLKLHETEENKTNRAKKYDFIGLKINKICLRKTGVFIGKYYKVGSA